MIFQFKKQFPQLDAYWDRYLPYQKRIEIPAKTVLLEEGKNSQQAIYIETGCLRTYFNNNGDEKTMQFFFEGEGLTSLDSFINNAPSPFSVETLEPSAVYLLEKKHVVQLLDELSHEPGFLQMFLKITARRVTHYSNEFVSSIRDTPEQRYQYLLRQKPHLIQRVAQHYIASYLGISTVHLSRIKSKLAKGKDRF